MRKSLSDRGVAALKPRAERYAFPDPGNDRPLRPGTAKRRQTFAAIARTPAGKQIWTHIGAAE